MHPKGGSRPCLLARTCFPHTVALDHETRCGPPTPVGFVNTYHTHDRPIQTFTGIALSRPPKSRAQSAIDTLEEVIETVADNQRLHKNLLDLKKLFEATDDMLQKCLPKPSSASLLGKVKRNARRFLFSAQNRKILLEYCDRLSHMKQDIQEGMQAVVIERQKAIHEEDEQQMNRIENHLRALKISRDTSADPALQLAKRQLKGNVIYEELVELEESLGSGSFGVVMEATYYGRPVALKRALNPLFGAQERENFR